MTDYSGSPVHDVCSQESAWTTTNVGEALPGVLSPLSWTALRGPLERGLRAGLHDLGGLRRDELEIPDRVEDRMIAVFYGRCAANVDPLRRVSDRIPGTSGDAFERQIFGGLRPGVASRPEYRRYPAAAAMTAYTASRLGRRLRALSPSTHTWWLELCIDRTRTGPARALLTEAQRRFETTFRPHMAVRVLAGGAFDRLEALGAPPGYASRAVAAARSGADLDEMGLLTALTEVAAGGRTLDDYLRHYGFHGPAEGDLASRSWREDPAPLKSLAEKLGARGEVASPAGREDAVAEFLSQLRRTQRSPARALLRATRHYSVLGEIGKACFLRAIDGMRLAVRQRASELLERGIVDDTDAVYFLTEAEAFDEHLTRSQAAELIAVRRADHAEFSRFTLPAAWTGAPQRCWPTTEPATVLTGVGASAGRVTGPARVVVDPGQSEIEDGEILVAEFTDPSWTPLMYLAAGLVIDIGGAMSHGAVIARELDVPCVIGTRDGTRRIRTGDLITIDGSAGTVAIDSGAMLHNEIT